MEEEVYLHLYDFYTKGQLQEIAKHNRVTHKYADKKINIAKAIIGFFFHDLIKI